MQIGTVLAVLLMLISVSGQEAFSAVIEYNFTGKFTYLDNANGGFQNSAPLHANDVVTGSFSFDPTLFTDHMPADPARGLWKSSQMPVPASFSFSLDGFGVQSQSNSNFSFDVTTPAETGVQNDALILEINSNLALTGGWSSNVSPFLVFELANSSGNVITSKQFAQLPILNKAEFPIANFVLDFRGNPATIIFPNTSVSSSDLFVGVNLDSITLVPEPSTLILFGVAFFIGTAGLITHSFAQKDRHPSNSL